MERYVLIYEDDYDNESCFKFFECDPENLSETAMELVIEEKYSSNGYGPYPPGTRGNPLWAVHATVLLASAPALIIGSESSDLTLFDVVNRKMHAKAEAWEMKRRARDDELRELVDRATYERLKAKYEGKS
jgi:hypothetical protein